MMIRNKRKAKKAWQSITFAQNVKARRGWRERRMKVKRNFFSQLVITYYPSNENALAHVE